MSSQYGELWPTNGWNPLAGLGHPTKFQRVSCLGFVICMMFGRLRGWYTVHIFGGLLPPNGILSGVKFTLHQSLGFSYIGSVTAWHSSSVCQPNFAKWDKEGNYRTFTPRLLHLYSAEQPSCSASAHILLSHTRTLPTTTTIPTSVHRAYFPTNVWLRKYQPMNSC